MSLVVDVTTSLLVVLDVTSWSVGTFPPDGVVVGNTGDPNVAPLIYGYTTVGKRVPAVNDKLDGIRNVADFLGEDALDNGGVFFRSGVAVGSDGGIVSGNG